MFAIISKNDGSFVFFLFLIPDSKKYVIKK